MLCIGLQKMEDSTEVKAVLKALIPKIMACGEEIPAYVCYLILEFNNQFHLNLEQEVNIFNKISTSVTKHIEKLNSTLSDTSTLDLHNQSHELAKAVLEYCTYKTGDKIVYGRASHSKYTENRMQLMTHQYLDNHGIPYQDDLYGGLCVLGDMQEQGYDEV